MNPHLQQGVEKRHERREDKAKFDEKAEFMPINEHFEKNFNAVLSSAIVFQRLLSVCRGIAVDKLRLHPRRLEHEAPRRSNK